MRASGNASQHTPHSPALLLATGPLAGYVPVQPSQEPGSFLQTSGVSSPLTCSPKTRHPNASGFPSGRNSIGLVLGQSTSWNTTAPLESNAHCVPCVPLVFCAVKISHWTTPYLRPSRAAFPMTLKSLAGKYLTFVLGTECYGIPVLKVREIISMYEITPVPEMPDYIKGVINLRGKIIPVADMRLKFRLQETENTEFTCIVVVQVQSRDDVTVFMGMIVDSVEEVVTIPGSDIEPPPDFGTTVAANYIVGMAKLKGRVRTLLDIDRVIAATALKAIPGVTAAAH